MPKDFAVNQRAVFAGLRTTPTMREAAFATSATGRPVSFWTDRNVYRRAAGLRLSREGRKTWFLLYYAPGSIHKRRYYFGEHPSGRLGQSPLSLPQGTSNGNTPWPRGDLARGIDPQLKTVAVDPETAKLIPSALLPEDLRKIFPEGIWRT